MMLLYAVVPADAVVPESVGVCGGRLEPVRAHGIAVVVEECGRLPDADQSSATRFAHLLTELNRAAPVLPVRFPTAMRSQAEVRAELGRRATDWCRRLDELDGMVELIVRVSAPEPDPAASGECESGDAYLRRRAAVVHAHESLVTRLSETAAPWCREVRPLAATRDVRLACLVSRGAVPKLRQALDECRGSLGDHEIRISGPMPPFSFAEETGARHP